MIGCWLFITTTCLFAVALVVLILLGALVARAVLETDDPLDLDGQPRVGL